MRRCIDADALIHNMRERFIDEDGLCVNEYWSAQEVLKAIENEQTADVVEVVHGEWIPSRFKTLQEDGWCECSVCGVGNKLYDRGVRKSDVPYIDGKSYELKNIANYCPNCGAKMDLKGETDEQIH